MFHWAEQKIPVHVFYRVLGLAIAYLMRRHAARAGLDMSARELLTTLASIGETVMIYPSTGGRPKARRMLTEMTPIHQHLFELFSLASYARALRSYNPAASNQPPASANTQADQESPEIRARDSHASVTDHALALRTGPDGGWIICGDVPACRFIVVNSMGHRGTQRGPGAFHRPLPMGPGGSICRSRSSDGAPRASGRPYPGRGADPSADLVQPKPDVGSCQLVKPLGIRVRVDVEAGEQLMSRTSPS
jgi:hypothetical protein